MKGPNDPDPGQAGAEWCLQGPLEDSDFDPTAPPLPRADRRLLTESRDRAAAQAELAAVHVSLTHLHPVTQAAALFCGWRLLGPTGLGPAGPDIEAAALAGRCARAMD